MSCINDMKDKLVGGAFFHTLAVWFYETYLCFMRVLKTWISNTLICV